MQQKSKCNSSNTLPVETPNKIIYQKVFQSIKPQFIEKINNNQRNTEKLSCNKVFGKNIHKNGCNSEISSLDKKLNDFKVHQYYRKTVPCIQYATSSLQNEKKVKINSKSRQKDPMLFLKNQLKSKNKIKQAKCKSSLKNVKKQKKFKENTSAEQGKKKFKLCQDKLKSEKQKQKQKHFRRSKQTCLQKSKSKSKTFKNIKQVQYEFKKQKKVDKSKQVKSSCITRNVSRNNSKQKQYNINAELKEKFKKKTPVNVVLEKKLKKVNAYSSMKISPRNSFQIIQTKSDEFLIMGQQKDSKVVDFISFRKLKMKSKQIQIDRIKSLQNISEKFQELIKQKDQSNNSSNKGLQTKEKSKQFSFLKPSHQKNTQRNNQNEISIDNFLQNTREQIQFNIECEQSLKQRLSRIEDRSLKQLKQEELQSMQRLQALNNFQDQLNNERSYSMSSELFQLAQINKVNFLTLKSSINQLYLKQRVQIVDWISKICSTMMLKTQTFHLAVAYFDLYVSSIQIKTFFQQDFSKLKLIGLGCLLIAIKMDQREYEHDVLNVFYTLEKQFHKNDIVKTEFQILKKFKLKLKIQTLSFWLDYFSLKWDHYLANTINSFQQKQNMFLRSVDGKSYENYKKATEIMNAILIEGGIFKHGFIGIILSIFFLLFQQIIRIQHRQKVFEQINNFKKNAQTKICQEKQTLPNFATQDTLDQLSLNDLKQNMPQNQQTLKNQDSVDYSGNKINLRKSANKKQNLRQFLQKLTQFYESFVFKYGKRQLMDFQKTIKYVERFSQIKSSHEMDPRLYQQAQSYQEFIRFHSYCHSTKFFVKKMYEDSTKMKQQCQTQTLTYRRQSNFQNVSSQIYSSTYDMRKNSLKQKYLDEKDYNINCFLNHEVDQIFTDQQIGSSV